MLHNTYPRKVVMTVLFLALMIMFASLKIPTARAQKIEFVFWSESSILVTDLRGDVRPGQLTAQLELGSNNCVNGPALLQMDGISYEVSFSRIDEIRYGLDAQISYLQLSGEIELYSTTVGLTVTAFDDSGFGGGTGIKVAIIDTGL